MTTHSTPQSRCRFAIATSDITPPKDIYHRMWGAAKHERATGIHRPLRASAAIFAPLSGEQKQIVLALDHCVLGREELQTFLKRVSTASGVTASEMVVVFSHTHAAGLMSMERAELPGGDLIAPYLAQLAAVAAAIINEALGRLIPVTLTYGFGRCNLAAHRDFWDEKIQQVVVGYNPTGEADDTVLVIRASADDGKPIAVIVNYACHPTTLAWDNTLISPDFPGAMRETIESVTQAPCLFLQGASGELGPREGFVGDCSIADRNGRQLAHAALSALESMPPAGTHFEYTGAVVSGATIGTWRHTPLSESEIDSNAHWQIRRYTIPLPIKSDTPTQNQVQADLKHWQDEEVRLTSQGLIEESQNARAMAERKRRMLHRLKQIPPGDNYPIETVLMRIGPAFWVVVQGEYYQTFQTSLRKRFPATPIVVSTIASDWGASYLPPAEIYGRGIYQESIAIVAAGGLEKMIQEIGDEINLWQNLRTEQPR